MFRRNKIRLLLSFCSLLFFSGTLLQLVQVHINTDVFHLKSLMNFSILPIKPEEPVDWDSKIKMFTTDILVSRRKLLQDSCQQSNLVGKTVINRREFFYLKNESLVWCPVYKAASTSWIKNLYSLIGLGPENVTALDKKFPGQLDRQLRSLAPVVSLKEIGKMNSDSSNVTSLLVTRHPFTRLVSAFRDKIERCHEVKPNSSVCDGKKDWYYKKYGQEMIRRYRSKYKQKFGEDSLLEKNNYGSPFPTFRSADWPTFWEFVQYVNSHAKLTTLDPHWRPVYVFCTPCSFYFKYLLKFENIKEEQAIMSRILPHGYRMKPTHENELKGGLKEEDIIEKYFDTLSDSDITQLVDLYRPDFAMFNYTFSFRNKTYI